MKFSNALRSLFFSWDLWLAVIVMTLILVFAPNKIGLIFSKDILGISISVLSIIFAVFFAALAILITAGDNEFIRFLEEDGSFSRIIWTFRVTLMLLFVALLSSIVLYVVISQYSDIPGCYYVPKWLFLIYAFLSSYALFATGNSTLDAVKYAELRARFLKVTREK